MELKTAITIRKKTTKFVKMSTRYPISSNGYYATEPFENKLQFGMLVGKSVSILGPYNNECIVRICNTNDHDVAISPNERILNLHQVEVLESDRQPTQPFNQAKFEQVMKDVKIGTKNQEIREKLKRIIAENLEAFAIEDEPLGSTDQAVYDLDTGDTAPVSQQRYRTPYYIRDEMRKIIDKNVDSGLMEPCSSPYAAPVLLVKKANGTWRLVCDYRRLNSVTISDCYPLPEIEDLVTSLSESSVYSATDLWSGFHQIPTSERAKEKLAVTTEFGQFTWNKMPMGTKNAPSVFQRLMDRVFQTIPRSQLVIYLDDMLIHSKSEAENLRQLEEVFSMLKQNGLKIRASKTELITDEVKFCGYIIKKGMKRPNPTKVAAVRELKPPTSKKEAQSLFGLLNFHRHYIKHFAQKASPITKSYKGTFRWTYQAQQAMELLKNEICQNALQLRIPSVNKAKFVLETDASNEGYGAVLFVCNSTKEHKNHNCRKIIFGLDYHPRSNHTSEAVTSAKLRNPTCDQNDHQWVDLKVLHLRGN